MRPGPLSAGFARPAPRKFVALIYLSSAAISPASPSVAEPAPVGASQSRALRARALRLVDVLLALTEADLRARYGRGPWRLIKWLLDPFALVGVYLILVAVLLDRPGTAPGLSLACAVVPFQLMVSTVVNSFDAINARSSIVANMAFRRLLLPLTSALTESIAFIASLLLLAGMMAAYGVAPTIAVLWLPLVLAVNLLLAAAVAFPASLIGLWVRDLRQFLISAVRTLFFLAPGLVALDQIGGSANQWVRLNPLTGLFEAYRAVLLHGAAPAPWELIYPLVWAALLAAAFVPIWRREQSHIAKVLD